jgi:hypothetical protein
MGYSIRRMLHIQHMHIHQDLLYGSGSKKVRLFDRFCGWQIGIGSGMYWSVLHTGLISCSTGTSIPPKVENPGSTSVVGSRD